MAIKKFTVGKVEVNSNVLTGLVENAAPTFTINIGDVTAIGMTWREIISLAKSWSLSLTVKTYPANTAYAAIRTEFMSGDGLITTLNVYEDGTKYFTGSCYVTQFAPTKSVGNVDSTAITFEGTGTPSYV